MARGNDCSFIFWLDASTPVNLEQDLSLIANKICLGGPLEKKEDKLKLIKDVLERSGKKWLIVLDGLDDPDLFQKGLDDYFPDNGHGRFAITSRRGRSNMRDWGEVFDVEQVEEEEGLQIIFSNREPEERQKEEEDAKALLARLDYLALAIDIAARFVAEGTMTFAQYLGNLRNESMQESVLHLPRYAAYCKTNSDSNSDDNGDNKPVSVFRTCEITLTPIEALRVQDETQAEGEALMRILLVSSHVHSSSISTEWFKNYGEKGLAMKNLPGWMNYFITAGHWDEIKFASAINKLIDRALIKRVGEQKNSQTGAFGMHALVRDSIKARTPTKTRNSTLLDALRLLWCTMEKASAADRRADISSWRFIIFKTLLNSEEDKIFNAPTLDKVSHRLKVMKEQAREEGYSDVVEEINIIKRVWTFFGMPMFVGPLDLLKYRISQAYNRRSYP